MYQVLSNVLRVVLLRASPAVLPSAGSWWLTLFILTWLTQILLAQVTAQPYPHALFLLDVALLVGISGGLLSRMGRLERLRQTTLALLGVSFWVNLVATLCLSLSAHDAPLSALLGLMLTAWGLLAIAHIWRCAFEWHFQHGLMLAMVYYACMLGLLNILFSR